MSSEIPQTTFHYSAHGHGLSARFGRPIEHLVDVQAASSLPTTGGHGTSRVDNFSYQELISFKAAYSHVSGSHDPKKGHYTTLVTSTVEGLNVQDVVTADRLVSRLASWHPGNHEEAHVVMLGSKFDNLQIAGCRVDVELNHDFFLRLDTFDALVKELAKNKQFRKMAEDPYETGKAAKLQGVLLCSLAKEIKTSCPGVTRHGHCLNVPQFGRVYLAEVIAKHGTRTLTMLRMELGCPVTGLANAAESVVNGHTWP